MRVVHVLTNVMDPDRTNTVEVEDDGPFPMTDDGEPNPGYRQAMPSQGRQRVLSMLRMRGVRDPDTGIVVQHPGGDPVWRLLSGTSGVPELAAFIQPAELALTGAPGPVAPDDLAAMVEAPRTASRRKGGAK